MDRKRIAATVVGVGLGLGGLALVLARAIGKGGEQPPGNGEPPPGDDELTVWYDIPPTLSVNGGDELTAVLYVRPPAGTWGYNVIFWLNTSGGHRLAWASSGAYETPTEGYYSIPCTVVIDTEYPPQPGDVANRIILDIRRGTKYPDDSWSWERIYYETVPEEVVFD